MHAFLKQVAKLDLQVFVTEFNIDNSQLATKSEKREKQVAQLCRDYLKNVLKHPQVTAVLAWRMVSHPPREQAGSDRGSESSTSLYRLTKIFVQRRSCRP